MRGVRHPSMLRSVRGNCSGVGTAAFILSASATKAAKMGDTTRGVAGPDRCRKSAWPPDAECRRCGVPDSRPALQANEHSFRSVSASSCVDRGLATGERHGTGDPRVHRELPAGERHRCGWWDAEGCIDVGVCSRGLGCRPPGRLQAGLWAPSGEVAHGNAPRAASGERASTKDAPDAGVAGLGAVLGGGVWQRIAAGGRAGEPDAGAAGLSAALGGGVWQRATACEAASAKALGELDVGVALGSGVGGEWERAARRCARRSACDVGGLRQLLVDRGP